jgi:mycothiol synthase
MLDVPVPTLSRLTVLNPDTALQVRGLEARARALDGVGALSEQALLWLDAVGRVQHLLAYADDTLAGYAQIAVVDEEASAELVVDPDHRRHGIGRALLDEVALQAPGARVWAHGNLAAARALAARAGWEVGRELHKMARPLSADDLAPDRVALPEGFWARTFEPGRDEQPWLETNAAAFAHHPEQGRLGLADLAERMAQDWFDPEGLIIVETREAPGLVAAFHWTKVDPEQRSSLDPTRTAGEVYVVGVHPAYQGRGLGRPVTALGLAHLARLGLPEVVLYVDGDNRAAIRTYTGLGFRSIMVDVMYSHPVHLAPAG